MYTLSSFCDIILLSYAPVGADSLSVQSSLDNESHVKTVVFFALVPVVVVFSFVIFIFYRKRREAYFRQTEAELNLKIAQESIRAVKAQINPHFIFNCMNSIHHYMNRNDVKKAGDYLIKFSQLIRTVLENASHNTIAVEEEMRALELYIQLEQLRLNNSFSYEIKIAETIDGNAEVPNFLIQPFVENAIWHGLTKVSDGKLSIELTSVDHGIACIVESTGMDFKPTAGQPGLESMIEKTSMGVNLIRERVELINRTGMKKASFTMRDASEMGKYRYCVNLFLPIYSDD